jgi:hypothetical protein
MKKLFTVVTAILICSLTYGQDYIRSNKIDNGTHIIEAYPSMFQHQTEQYLLCWNYMEANGNELYYLSILCSDQVAPWHVKPGDKAYLRLLLESDYHEITALLDATPERYTTADGSTKYRTLASYLIPQSLYDSLYKGFDRFLIKAHMQKNNADVSIAVEMPFSAIEHMLKSYLDIMNASGK